MEQNKIIIRPATTADAGKLLEIYGPYVENTAITFEYEVPSEEEFARRIATVLEKYPYLVAEWQGEPVGYAYVGPFKARPAYDWTVETSIYIHPDRRKHGIGGLLHKALEQTLEQMGILNMEACIAYPVCEDPYLDRNSVEFHSHLGYRLVGEFEKCGYKFHRWYNMVWMEKQIGEHKTEQPPVIPYPQLQIK